MQASTDPTGTGLVEDTNDQCVDGTHNALCGGKEYIRAVEGPSLVQTQDTKASLVPASGNKQEEKVSLGSSGVAVTKEVEDRRLVPPASSTDHPCRDEDQERDDTPGTDCKPSVNDTPGTDCKPTVKNIVALRDTPGTDC